MRIAIVNDLNSMTPLEREHFESNLNAMKAAASLGIVRVADPEALEMVDAALHNQPLPKRTIKSHCRNGKCRTVFTPTMDY